MPVAVSPSRPRLDALTSIRFFAALHVVLYHFFRANAWHWTQIADKHLEQTHSLTARILDLVAHALFNIVGSGGASVGLFFVLSGFILAYSYLDVDGRLTSTRQKFWINRFARIYPTYLLGLLLVARFVTKAPVWSAPPSTVKVIFSGLLNLTLIQAWFPKLSTTWNFPGWSLSVEAFFYLMFPWLTVWFFRTTNRRKLAWIVGICLTVVTAIGLLRWLLTSGVVGLHVDDGLVMPLTVFFPLSRLPEFVLGIALGRLFADRCHVQEGSTQHCDLITPAVWGLNLLPLSILITLSIPDVGLWAGVRGGLLAAQYALLIYGLSLNAVSRQGLLVPILSIGWLLLLGEASYALYIIHVPFGHWFDLIPHSVWADAAHRFFLNLDPGFVSFAVFLVGAIAASVLVFKFFETPARLWFRKVLERGATVVSRGRSTTAPPVAAKSPVV